MKKTTKQPEPARYTPGPWQTNPAACAVGPQRWRDGRDIICASPTMPFHRLDKRTRAEHEANMRLIAAAPELVEALRDWIRLEDEGPGKTGISALALYQRSRAALAKATGKDGGK